MGTIKTFLNSLKTPQAQADDLGYTEEQIESFIQAGRMEIDVLANDLGGSAKYVWSFASVTSTGQPQLEIEVSGLRFFIENGKVYLDLSPQYLPTIEGLGAGNEAVSVFDYTIRLANGTLSSTTATVRIDGINDLALAQADAASGDEDTPITGQVTATDVDGDSLTYVLVQGAQDADGKPVAGLTFNPDGSYSFQGPQDFNGTVTFTYKANDGSVDSNVATVTLTVTPVNDAALAQADAASGDEDTPITGQVTATDVDGDSLTYVLVQGAQDADGKPVAGLTFNPDGSYSFQGPQDFNGTVTFTYKANDGSVDSNVATVTLTVTPVEDTPVNASPTALNDRIALSNDVTVTIPVSWLLKNDVDSDGDTLVVTGVTNLPTGWTLQTNDAGHVTEIRTSSMPSREVVLSYTLSDGKVTGSASVTLFVPVQTTGVSNIIDLREVDYDFAWIDAKNGADTFYFGSSGQDNFLGSGGNDTFKYTDWSQGAVGAGRDVILDFNVSGVDTIDISGLASTSGNVTAAWNNASDILTFSDGGTNTIEIRLQGVNTLTANSIIGESSFFIV
ncbi:hypothetical protein DC522_06095 [Microvirga sp. KLBC 81]|uniref:tandem-95 repeat protein n=1 Tax=Microvirga sp. KLBC 81 TaxID=1862707 RepID=UPI000D516980|nr:tandem-95 repeat protein [Microvirga sp. KLBC 81]PVE25465.1 hypothetical protein DC522_06095 [Microvirga sp. KLBC 81]